MLVISLLPIAPATLLPSRHLVVSSNSTLDVSSLPCIAFEFPTVGTAKHPCLRSPKVVFLKLWPGKTVGTHLLQMYRYYGGAG
jgi:hypothetical protein